MACNFNHVKKAANDCKENPAGVSNYCMIVPFASAVSLSDKVGLIDKVEVLDAYNIYKITAEKASGSDANVLKGYKVEFKNQTGQVTSEDNGAGKGNTVTGTGRVEIGIDQMAVLNRTLSNLDGNFLAFFPTGAKKADPSSQETTELTEWLVVGNESGDISWSRASDTGAARGDDHGTTFTVVCDFQVYDTVKFYGEIGEMTVS